MTWDERETTADFETEHFQRCLAERLSWAVADAERAADAPETEMSPPLAPAA